MDFVRQAAILRSKIIEVCSRNGGHLGASLGAVELTLALHTEFESPKDLIVWDIGHQSYAHKILTDRSDCFDQIRLSHGPSGFTCRTESPHDPFGAGHSSTSISAALGIAEAKRLKRDKSWTVAIIGDGALTAGLAFEALNQAGAAQTPNLLIVVNDNRYSISPNVGALDRWAFGMEREPRRFFEALGFDYHGPIDGHDVQVLKKKLSELKALPQPKVRVLHALTVKGKGFAPAESEPVKFHGVGPFDKLTGKSESKGGEETYSSVFGKELMSLAYEDKRLVAITAAMAEGTGLANFAKHFPERFYDVGIAEPHALVFAAGMATQGFHPVVAIYSTFLQRAVDSLIHDVALQNLDVILVIDRAGLVGADGPTHHGLFDVSILRCIPGVVVAAPSSAEDLCEMLRAAKGKSGLVAIRFPRGNARRDTAHFCSPWLKGRSLTQDALYGRPDIALWALGNGTNWALEALELLEPADKSRIALVDARFAKPIDTELLRESLKTAKALVTVEDGVVQGGFGAAVTEAAVESGIQLPERVKLLGAGNFWVKHGDIEEQRHLIGTSAIQIAEVLKRCLSS